MKKAISLLAITAFMMTASCKKNDGFATMEFAKSEHDFGTINEGDKVETSFEFTNTGGADLLITDAKGSCGCTVPEYPKTAVKPGDKGTIKVSFNSNHKKGKQKKTVTLTANTKAGKEMIKILADVTPDPNKKDEHMMLPPQPGVQTPKKIIQKPKQ